MTGGGGVVEGGAAVAEWERVLGMCCGGVVELISGGGAGVVEQGEQEEGSLRLSMGRMGSGVVESVEEGIPGVVELGVQKVVDQVKGRWGH